MLIKNGRLPLQLNVGGVFDKMDEMSFGLILRPFLKWDLPLPWPASPRQQRPANIFSLAFFPFGVLGGGRKELIFFLTRVIGKGKNI